MESRRQQMFISTYSGAGSLEAIRTASEAGTKANQASSDTLRLRREINRLLMINEALWEILRDREGLKDEDLVRKIDEIDLRDGVLNGRREKATPKDCSECGRTLPRRQPVCIYCGTDAENRDPFGV
jgi:hypothetical protein